MVWGTGEAKFDLDKPAVIWQGSEDRTKPSTEGGGSPLILDQGSSVHAKKRYCMIWGEGGADST